jgi:hypothetical protein
MLYAPLTSPMHATCPAHLILLALITQTILGKEYKVGYKYAMNNTFNVLNRFILYADPIRPFELD